MLARRLAPLLCRPHRVVIAVTFEPRTQLCTPVQLRSFVTSLPRCHDILDHLEMAKAQGSASVRRGNRPSDQKTGPKGSPMTPIPSASLIVLCPTSANPSQHETVMLQRSARDGSSFRSAVVFPGGALDLADETPYLTDDPSKAPSAEEAAKLPPLTAERDGARYMAALKLCALRETFEETGLLLVPSSTRTEGGGPPRSRAVSHKDVGMTSEEWATVREEVHNDASLFPALLRRVTSAVADPYGKPPPSHGSDASTVPALAPMAHHSNWITPRSVVRPAKRFDAHFFVTVLDQADVFGSKQGKDAQANVVEISADGTETTKLLLSSPHQLVQDALADKFVLFPPQFYILADLACVMGSGRGVTGIVPLNFRGPSQDGKVTPVEEEAQGLQGRNYTWEKRPPGSAPPPPGRPETSWVSYRDPPFVRAEDGRLQAQELPSGVTAIEPCPMPKRGANVAVPTRTSSGEWEQGAEDEPFTFPLCLPGDKNQSRDQADVAGLPYGSGQQTGSGPDPSKAWNRVFVSPRTKKDGGGLVVRGIRRRGVAGLRDFEYGTIVEDHAVDADDESEGGAGKAKL